MFQVCRLVSSRLAPATGKKEWPCLSLPRLAAASAGHACESCVTAQTLDNSHIHILFIFTLHLQYTFNLYNSSIRPLYNTVNRQHPHQHQ